MKRKGLIFSLTALLMGFAATSCSNDDDFSAGTTAAIQGESYISVSIKDVGNLSGIRATTDNGYAYGTAAENAVKKAYFYFFDANGFFMQRAALWGNGTQMGGEAAAEPVVGEEYGNVEYFGKATIPLHDINPSNKPTQMVSVLNPSSTLDAKTFSTLNELLAELTQYANADNDFTMTSSTYMEDESAGTVNVGVTALDPEAFKSTSEEAAAADNNDCVEVYVERLAAKVQVGIDETANVDSEGKKLEKGTAENTYKIADVHYYTYTTDGGLQVNTSLPLYANLIAWGLNATTKQSYLMKHIDGTWTDTNLGFDWNNTDHFRTFWCQSYNYGKSLNYPDHYILNDETELYYKSANELTYALSLNGNAANAADTYTEYCNENTNTGDVLLASHQSTATCVLVKACLTGSNGTSVGDVIEYNGDFYTPEAYVASVHNMLKLGYTHNNGTPLSVSDLEIASGNFLNGRVVVKLRDGLNYTWDSYDGVESEDVDDSINKAFADFNNNDNDAIGFKDGLMYYNIPIEHLNQTENETTGKTITKIFEGHYGVVRNHWYKLTITALSNVGHGIWDPEEPIVPNPDTEEDYYIGANINILSWKTLTQTVTL